MYGSENTILLFQISFYLWIFTWYQSHASILLFFSVIQILWPSTYWVRYQIWFWSNLVWHILCHLHHKVSLLSPIHSLLPPSQGLAFGFTWFNLIFFINFIVSTEQHEIVLVKFDGKNYSLWEFQFCISFEGKGLLGILYGSKEEPIDDNEKAKWRTKNAWVIS